MVHISDQRICSPWVKCDKAIFKYCITFYSGSIIITDYNFDIKFLVHTQTHKWGIELQRVCKYWAIKSSYKQSFYPTPLPAPYMSSFNIFAWTFMVNREIAMRNWNWKSVHANALKNWHLLLSYSQINTVSTYMPLFPYTPSAWLPPTLVTAPPPNIHNADWLSWFNSCLRMLLFGEDFDKVDMIWLWSYITNCIM